MEEEQKHSPEEENGEAPVTLPVVGQLSLLIVILFLLFGSAITPSLLATLKDDEPQATAEPVPAPVTTLKNEKEAPVFADIPVTGKAAYVWDVSEQRALYKKNEAEQLPLASLTKLMTALVAHELLAEEDTITIDQTAVNQDGFSNLTAGEQFARETLSDLTLVTSSNDGAYALAAAAGALLTPNDPANAFVQAMNIRASELGLAQTFFKNPTGLDLSPVEGGAYGTARDMAFLMEYIIEHEPTILAFTKERELTLQNEIGLSHSIDNTNYYVDQIPGLLGSKTGFTDLAGGNLVVAFEAGLGRAFVVVVLGSTRQERFSDVVKLVEEVQQYVISE